MHICNLCKTKVVFPEDRAQLGKYMQVVEQMHTVKYMVVNDDDAFEEKSAEYDNAQSIRMLSMAEFLRFADDDAGHKLDEQLAARTEAADPRQCAIALYTSGTTGRQQGLHAVARQHGVHGGGQQHRRACPGRSSPCARS